MPPWSVTTNPIGDLTTALEEGLESEVANILKQNSNIIASQCSPPWLHLAIAASRNQHILLKHLLEAGTPLDATDKLGATALHVAAATQQPDCLEELLKHGASVDASDIKRKTALHYAAHSNSSDCITLLLKNGCNRDAADSEGKSPLHIAAREGSLAAVNALLMNGALPILQDNQQRTPLHLARVPSVAKVLMNAGADVTASDINGNTPLYNAVDRRPAMVTELLNSGVSVHGNIYDSKVKVFFNLNILKTAGQTSYGEMSLLGSIAHRGQYNLLKHPLCEIFLHLKWLRVYPLFVIKILIFIGLTISLTANVCLHADYPYQCETNTTSPEYNKSSAVCQGKLWSKVALVFFLTIIIMRQIVQVLLFLCNSYKHLSIWLELILTVCTLIVFSTVCDDELHVGWRHHFSVITVLLSWFQISALMGHMPLYGIYVQLFSKVSHRMVWFGFVFLSPLIGFCICFHLLFKDSSFHPLPTAFLKTLAMMVGELDIGDLIGGDDKIGPTVTSQLLLLAFILLMTVVTTNLLVGLAVSDISEMQKEAGVQRLALTVEHEEHVDIILYHHLVRRILPKKLVKWFQHHCSVLDNIPAHQLPLNMHNPWLSNYDTLKSGNSKGRTMESYNVMVYPNHQVDPGRIYRSSILSKHKPTSYILPPWIVANIRLLIKSQNKEEHKNMSFLDLQKQIADLQSTVALISQLGAVQKLSHAFSEIIDGISRPEAATIGCGRRPQHH